MAALRAVSRGLFWLLVAYWFVFIGYTTKDLVLGGPHAVVAWYRHLDRGFFEWNRGAFLIRQIAILAITLTAWFFGWRRSATRMGRC